MILDNCRLRNILPTLPEDVRDSMEAMFEGYADMVEDVQRMEETVKMWQETASTATAALQAHKAERSAPQAPAVEGAKKIKAKFDSVCKKCQGKVKMYDWVYWTPGIQGVTHIEGECK